VPEHTVDRQCGSSQQKRPLRRGRLISGQYDLVIGGRREMMSRCRWASSVAPARPADHRRHRERYGQGGFSQGRVPR